MFKPFITTSANLSGDQHNECPASEIGRLGTMRMKGLHYGLARAGRVDDSVNF